MNTPTNAYFTKFSSGLILVFLAFSGLLVLIPLATPVNAANASGPTIAVTSNNPVLGGAVGVSVAVQVTNPTSNQYTITGFSFVTPTGWKVTSCTIGGYLVSCNVGAGGSGATYTVSTFTVGTGAGIPPGSSDILTFTATAATGSTYPFTSTFTTKVQDASSIAFYNGPSFSVQVIEPTTAITVGTVPSQYVAGSAPFSVTATVSCTVSATCPSGLESGVSVTFSETGYTATATYSFTPASAISGSNGVATVKFQPSNHEGDSASVVATVGTSAVTGTSANAVTTLAGAPSQISWTLASAATNGNHYITTEGKTANGGTVSYTGATMATTGITFALADKFGNAETFATGVSLTAWSLTITALSGAGQFDALNLPTVISCTNGGTSWKSGSTTLTPTVACPSTASPNLPFAYFQSPTWGSIGQLSATITGTYAGSAFGGSGASKLLITSTFATGTSPIPVVTNSTATAPLHEMAGNKVNVTATLTPPATCGGTCPGQAGVPVELSLDAAASTVNYGAASMLAVGFGSGTSIIVNTNSAGAASSLFTISTTAGDDATFFSNATTIVDAGTPTALGPSAASGDVLTIANVPTTFTVITAYDPIFQYASTHAAAGTTIYVNVAISDAYGNPATNTANNQIQITLVTSCTSTCPISATTAYIPHGGSDTAASFGAIAWTMPTTIGQNVTVTASGTLGGKAVTSLPATIGIVSTDPTLAITSPTPLNGVIYSGSTSVVFTGNANASAGYAATGPYAVSITSITYKVDSGSVQSAPISSANKVTFSVAALISAGLHHITFNATDSNGNSIVGQTFAVLVDPSAPTITFVTPNHANLTNGASVTAAIVVAQGDLNASSVAATQNGTPVSASHISVSGANALGVNTTYTVTISGLAAGTDVIGLSASTLSGFSATASTITVTVTLPANQLFSVSGTAAGCSLGGFSGTCVSYTNQNTTAASVVVFAVWKNNAGQTMGVGTAGLTVASGATDEAFIPQPVGLSSGTYTVNIFVVTTSNIPVSLETTISVTV